MASTKTQKASSSKGASPARSQELAAKYQELAAQERDRVAAAGGDVVRFNEMAVNDLNALRGREDVRTLRNEVDQAYYDAAMRRQDAKGGKSSARRPQPQRTSDSGVTWKSAGARDLPPGYASSSIAAGRKRSIKESKELAEFQSRLRREEAEHQAAIAAERDDRALDRLVTYRGGSAWGMRAKVGPGGVKITSSGKSTWANGGAGILRGRRVSRLKTFGLGGACCAIAS